MQRIKIFTTTMIWVLMILLSVSLHGEVRKKHILYINSYEQGYGWSDNIFKGIKHVLKSKQDSISLQIEYMDSKKYYDKNIIELLYNYYKYKFKNTQFDLILTSDNNAFEFMLKYRDELFPNIPMVFCGVNYFDDVDISKMKNITGVVENIDFKDNFETATSFHPEASKMIIIGNQSVTSKAIVKQIKKSIREENIQFHFEFWTELYTPDIFKKLKQISPGTIIYFVPFYEIHHRGVYNSQDIMRAIQQATLIPVYSSWYFFVGHGMVGGKLTSGFQQGKRAMELVLRVLNGEKPDNIPIIEKPILSYIFDYNLLKFHHIDTSRLPSNSTIVNEPYTFYQLDRQVFWLIILFVFILICITIVLTFTIIKRKAAEKYLRQAEEKYRGIFENASKGIVITDREGNFTEINQSFAKLLNFSDIDSVLSHWSNLFDIFLKGRRKDAFLIKIKKGTEVFGDELRFLNKHGEIRWAIVNAKPVNNPNFKTHFFEFICEDITERKQANQAMTESKEKLRLILDNIPQLVYWQDDKLKFIDVNKSFLAFFKVDKPEDIIGKKIRHVLNEDDTKRSEDLNKQVINENKAYYRTKWSIHNFNNDKIWLEINKIPLHNERGDIVGVLSTAEDITKEVTLERQLRQSQKMEALGILSGGIAHDFNNILTSVINSTELAIEDVPLESPTSKDLKRVLKASYRGSDLVKQILTFSRSSHHEFRVMDISTVVAEGFELIKTSMPGNIHVVEEISIVNKRCFGNPSQIHQVIMNLCNNAFQAMKNDGGQLGILLREVSTNGDMHDTLNLATGNYVKLSIYDNGSGIEPQILDKIFDPFFTTKSKNIGTGLGLAVVHGIIKGHQGEIVVKSQPANKTEFNIFIPIMNDISESSVTPASGIVIGNESILFVEDDEDQRESVPRILSKLGYDVVAVEDAVHAVNEFRKNPKRYQLVITDFDMPRVNGVEMSRQLVEINPKVPVIMVSGREAERHIGTVKNINGYINKPYDKSKLSQTIRLVLEGFQS